MRGRRGALVAATTAALVASVLTACTGPSPTSSGGTSATRGEHVTGTAASRRPVLAGASVRRLADRLPQRSIAPAVPMRLKAGLVPPTNRWFSGLVFGAKPQPVFPFPLRFEETSGGFSASLPTVSAGAKTIAAAAGPALTVGLGATATRVSAYDEVSVTLEQVRGGTVLGRTTIAEGSPMVSYRASRAQQVRLSAPVTRRTGSTATVNVGGRLWGVATKGAMLHGSSVGLARGGSLVLVPFPSGAAAAQQARLLAAATSPLVSVSTSFGATTSSRQTALGYRTASGSRTLVVPLPHQQGAAGRSCGRLRYSTIYGSVPVCVDSGLTFTTPTIEPTSSLDLSSLSAAEKRSLTAQLKRDVAADPPFAGDTYFGGKTLYRSAMLLQIARTLHDTTAVKTLTSRLTAELDRWMQPGGCRQRKQECFVYDPRLKTVVGLANSFGSEQDNDHHFHYGYFLYAAGVVAAKDAALAKRWAPVMNLLAADLAARTPGSTSGTFPTSRVYDPYFSHSWASGYSPFADGNNQESSSEAINAWTGLSLWAAASGDKPLAAEAAWLLSGETASALAYWVHPDLSDPAFKGFSAPMVSLNWGGKRDFATWFSAEPSAIVGIQLVPMSPVSSYLASRAAGGTQHIERLVKAAAPKRFATPLGDYLLMYLSLAGPSAARRALTVAKALPASGIDNGDSRTYLLAYIMSNLHR